MFPATARGQVSVSSGLFSVDIDSPSSTIPQSGSIQLSVRLSDSTGAPIKAALQWSSSNPRVVSVGPAGRVRGIALGSAVVSVTANTGHVLVAKTIPIHVVPRWAGAPPPANVLVNDAAKGTLPAIAQSEPSIAVSGNRIVVGFTDEAVSFGRTLRGIRNGVGHSFSTDGGATFTDAGGVGQSNWGGLPAIAVDGSGNVYVARFDLVPGMPRQTRIAVFKSTDGGETFLQSSTANDTIVGRSAGVDKPALAVDNTAAKGNVYVSWTLARAGVLNIWFASSTDGGATFSAPIQISSGGNDQGSSVALGPQGEVYVAWADQAAGKMFVRRSVDAGLSFADAVSAASFTAIGAFENATQRFCGRVLNGNVRARTWPGIAVDRSEGKTKGTIYLAFSSQDRGLTKADVFLTRSSDGGAVWTAPFRLNDDRTHSDQWLPSVAVAPSGAVAVSWYDRRRDVNNSLIDLFAGISSPGGESFGKNLKITDASFPPGSINGTLGFPPYACPGSAYNGIAADATHFHFVWTDKKRVRGGEADANIVFAKVRHPILPEILRK